MVKNPNLVETMSESSSDISMTSFTKVIDVIKIDYKSRDNYQKDIQKYDGFHARMLGKKMEIVDLDESKGHFIITYESNK